MTLTSEDILPRLVTPYDNHTLPMNESHNTGEPNTTTSDGCITILFREMEFLPWHNPDNIVSEEVETIVRRLKENLLVLLFLIGGPANVINMAVFYKQGLHDRVTLSLFALSLADELFISLSFLHYGEQLYIQFTTKERFGPIMTFLTNLNSITFLGFCFVSPLLSTIIAIERCICVFNPLKFQTLLSAKTMARIIIVMTVVVLSLFFIVVFRYRIGCIHDPDLGITVVTGIEGEFYRAHREFIDYLDSLVFGLGLPGGEMLVVTIVTIMTTVKLRQTVSWRSGSSSAVSPREVALTRMLIGNSILFVVCISPVAFMRFSMLLLPEVNSGRRHHNFFMTILWISEISTYTNSTFNIFIYYTMGSRYRETFWALFGRKRDKPES